MKLKALFENTPDIKISDYFQEVDIKSISCDSRSVERDSIFFALKGTQCDGANFIKEAVYKGAAVIVKNHCEANVEAGQNVCILSVANPRQVLCKVAPRFFDHPSRKIKTIGITGTNGKTTISYLLESILHAASKKCAVIGTVNYRIGKKVIPSKNTTPGLIDNQRYLADMVKEGMAYCVMEVSSHALDQGRVDAIDFQSAIFTNLTGDHMDYHRDMENYFAAKTKLFIPLSSYASAVINTDDPYGQRLVGMTQGKLVTYGLKNKADVTAKEIRLDFSKTAFTLVSPIGEIGIETKLIGRHNIYNILAASASCFSLGVSLKDIKAGVESLVGVPGRLEQVSCGQKFSVFVDYAHTEDALKNVLMNLKDVSRAKIILVFGCGGDRDRTKRPKMGKVASQLADFTIITSDNPRSEDPQAIIDEILKGFEGKQYEVILDREVAIKKSLIMAKEKDVVLIAGKGHEDYQIFKDKTIHFDDREIVRKLLTC